MKVVFSLTETGNDPPSGPTALLVNLNAKKVAQIRKLIGLCKKHRLSEVRVRDFDVRLFDYTEQWDVESAGYAAARDLLRTWQSRMEQAFPAEACLTVPAKFVLPVEVLRTAGLQGWFVELVAFDNEFFWSVLPERFDSAGYESTLFPLKDLTTLLKQTAA